MDVSTSALRDTLASIRNLLNPILGDSIIIFDNEPDRRYIGRMSSMSAPSVKGFNGVTFSVELQCLSYTQDLDETNTAADTWTGASPNTSTFTGIAGTVSRIPVEVYVRNETGQNLTGAAITVANDTTSETITWTGTINDDYWLRFGTIDSNGRFQATISRSTSSGADPEAESYVSVESGFTSGDWIRLLGGSTNSITITGLSAGRTELTYRGKYL